MSDIKISIKNLYKIYGNNPNAMLQNILDGCTKKNLLEKYNHVLGLNNINIDIEARGIHVIMGLSGSGKSTFIRHINRLIEPTSGNIIVDGQNVIDMSKGELRAFRRHKASMVFQKFGLLPHKTIMQNVAYGLLIQKNDDIDSNKKSQKWIDKVGLTGFENNYPYQLSGGMQQRVGLARALATNADILLMDEAFSSLDPLIRTNMQDVLLNLQEELHKTVIFITHDINEALRIADKISILRDGEIIQTGNPQDIILKPENDYIRDFIKDINRGRVIKVSYIMEKTNVVKGPKVLSSMNIEEALPIIAAAVNSFVSVVDKNDRIIGKVSLDMAISAISPLSNYKN
jgi:glycine betaine/proline transport system ATP-binding protein